MAWLRGFVVALVFSLPLLGVSAVGDEHGGGGTGEKNLVLAYETLSKAIALCLRGDCKMTPKELALLRKIQKDLPNEGDASTLLVFKSEAKNPGFFLIDGAVRTAKTAYAVGKPIYVNTDLLYPKNPKGLAEPLSIPAGTALLLHELGHHHGVKDHVELDLMGVKAQLALEAVNEHIRFYPPIFEEELRGIGILSLSTLHFGGATETTRLFASTVSELHDFQPAIAAAVKRDRLCDGDAATSLKLWNLHWSFFGLPPREVDTKAPQGIYFFADVIHACRPGEVGVNYRLKGLLAVDEAADHTLRINSQGFRVKFIDCHKHPDSCP